MCNSLDIAEWLRKMRTRKDHSVWQLESHWWPLGAQSRVIIRLQKMKECMGHASLKTAVSLGCEWKERNEKFEWQRGEIKDFQTGVNLFTLWDLTKETQSRNSRERRVEKQIKNSREREDWEKKTQTYWDGTWQGRRDEERKGKIFSHDRS